MVLYINCAIRALGVKFGHAPGVDSLHRLTMGKNYQRTIGPENAHLKPDPAVLSHHEMTLTLNTHTPLLNS